MSRAAIRIVLPMILLIPFCGPARCAAPRTPQEVIFSAEQSKKMTSLPGPFWTPTHAQVARFEAFLSPYLKKQPGADARRILKNLKGYRRQYVGFTMDRRRVIFVNALCERASVGLEWRTSFVQVNDGGACYFHAIYDPVKNSIKQFSINGEA